MLREEEDDMTQEIRQLVMFETKAEIDKVIEVIKNLKIEVKDGLVTGLDLAINVLKKDKNAISVPQT